MAELKLFGMKAAFDEIIAAVSGISCGQMMRTKESFSDGPTERADDTGRDPRPVAGWSRSVDGVDAGGLLDVLKKALTERALNAEMDHHLADKEAGNSRNGYGRKTVLTDTGSMALAIPRRPSIRC